MYFLLNLQTLEVSAHKSAGDAAKAAFPELQNVRDPMKQFNQKSESFRILNVETAFLSVAESDDGGELARDFAKAVSEFYKR